MEHESPDRPHSRRALIMVLWIIVGFLSWRIPSYTLSLIQGPLIAPAHAFMKSPLFSYIPWWFMAFISSFFLALGTGSNIRWLLGFIIGAAGYEAYTSTVQVLYYMNYFQDLSLWLMLKWIPVVARELIVALIPSLVILPLLSWLGSFLGNKLRLRNMALKSLDVRT